MELFLEYSSVAISILGVLAFATSLIVQLLKDLPFIEKMPTKLFVIIIAEVVTVIMLLIHISYRHLVLYWYYVVLAVFAGFVVAYIAMYGWGTLKELKDRFMK